MAAPETTNSVTVRKLTSLMSQLWTKIKNAINGKVDKETDKGLSTNDFTDAYKSSVDSNTSARHTHSNKAVLDEISSTDVANWDGKQDDLGISSSGDTTKFLNAAGNWAVPEAAEFSGTVPVSKGGTGKTSVTSGNYLVGNGTGALTEKTPNATANELMNALTTGNDDVFSTDYIIASNHTSGVTDATTFVRRTADKLWNWIKSKVATTSSVGVVSASTGLSVSSAGALSVKYGTASGTACQGNDSRLSDARTPTSHTHAASAITSGTFADARIASAAKWNRNSSFILNPTTSSGTLPYNILFTAAAARTIKVSQLVQDQVYHLYVKNGGAYAFNITNNSGKKLNFWSSVDAEWAIGSTYRITWGSTRNVHYMLLFSDTNLFCICSY